MNNPDAKNRLSTVQRIVAGFVAMLAMMGILSAISINRVQSINSMLDVVNDVNSVKQRYAINFRGSVHDRASRCGMSSCSMRQQHGSNRNN